MDEREREERAERIRAAFRAMPGFLDLLEASRQAEREGRYVEHADVLRRYGLDS